MRSGSTWCKREHRRRRATRRPAHASTTIHKSSQCDTRQRAAQQRNAVGTWHREACTARPSAQRERNKEHKSAPTLSSSVIWRQSLRSITSCRPPLQTGGMSGAARRATARCKNRGAAMRAAQRRRRQTECARRQPYRDVTLLYSANRSYAGARRVSNGQKSHRKQLTNGSRSKTLDVRHMQAGERRRACGAAPDTVRGAARHSAQRCAAQRAAVVRAARSEWPAVLTARARSEFAAQS